MLPIIERSLEAARKFTFWDFFLMKTGLISLGVLLGAYLSNWFIPRIAIVWLVFILSYIWTMYRTFAHHMKKR